MVRKGQENLIDLNNRNIQSLDHNQKMLVLLDQSIQCMKEVEPRENKKKQEPPKEGEDIVPLDQAKPPPKQLEEKPLTPKKEKNPFEHIKVKNIEKIIEFLH